MNTVPEKTKKDTTSEQNALPKTQEKRPIWQKLIPRTKKQIIIFSAIAVVAVVASLLLFKMLKPSQGDTVHKSQVAQAKKLATITGFEAKTLADTSSPEATIKSIKAQLAGSGVVATIDDQPLDKLWWVAYVSESVSRGILVPKPTAVSLTLPKESEKDEITSGERLMLSYKQLMLLSGFNETKTPNPEQDVSEFESSQTVCQLGTNFTGTVLLSKNEAAKKEKAYILACTTSKALDTAFKQQNPYLNLIPTTDDSTVLDSIDQRSNKYAYLTVMQLDLIKTKKLVVAKNDGSPGFLYESSALRQAPCLVLDALKASGTVYDECIATANLTANELEFIMGRYPFDVTYALQKYTGQHDFKVTHLTNPVLHVFTNNGGQRHYTYGVPDHDIQIYEVIDGVSSHYRSQNFNLAVYIQEITADGDKIKYGYYADGTVIYLIFDITMANGTKYEAYVLPSWVDKRTIKSIDELSKYLQTLKDFVQFAMENKSLADKISTNPPASTLKDLCADVNAQNIVKGGSGHKCNL